MEDTEILDLYWKRDERAIAETQNAYGSYCHSIAWRILYDREDADECVNDTWLRAWNAIPPGRPGRLALFLGTIALTGFSLDFPSQISRNKPPAALMLHSSAAGYLTLTVPAKTVLTYHTL